MSYIARLAVATTAAVLVASAASADTFVRIASGPAGGAWYPFGAKMAEIFQKHVPNVTASNAPGGGVANVRDVNRRNAEIGWTFGDTAYEGLNGKGRFKEANPNVRFFANTFAGVLQMAVPKNSSIKSVRDIVGKSISPGKLTFAGNAAFEKLANLYGVTYDEVRKAGGTIHRVDFADSAALMKDGHIELFVALTNLPNASFIGLDFQPGFRMLPVDPPIAERFVKENPGFIRTTIAKGAYTSITEDVPTIAAPTVMIINKDVPDDLVYQLTKALWERHAELVQVNKTWENVRIESAVEGAAIPVHPGALRYYKEMNVVK